MKCSMNARISALVMFSSMAQSCICSSRAPQPRVQNPESRTKPESRANPESRIPNPEYSAALDHLRERGDAADEPRVQRELAAMIFLVRNRVMHPREAQRGLAVELPDGLQHRHLAGRAETLRAVGVRALQRLEERGLRSMTGDAPRVLLEQLAVRL